MTGLTVEAGRSGVGYWRDLWRYRELFYFLAWRDLLVRYKQTVIGVAWSVIRPFLTMLILTVVFGSLSGMPSGGVPYALLVFCGMLPWQFLSNTLMVAGSSLVNNSSLVSKVYFPRLIVPTSSVIAGFVDFLISAVIMALLLLYYRYTPPLTILLLPFFVLLTLALSVGVAVLISALTVKYRDFRIIVPFIVQFGLYVSPVGFQSSVVPEQYRLVYLLNPMVGIIDGFRACTLGGAHTIDWGALLITTAETIAILAVGIAYFRRTERTFADTL